MIQTLIITLFNLLIRGLFFLKKDWGLRLIFKLYSTPNKGKYKKHKQSEILNNFQFEHHLLDGFQIPLYKQIKSNEYQNVLLIHGWNSNAQRWQKLISFLDKQPLNIFVIEAPGHGCHSNQYFSIPAYANDINHLNSKFKFNFMIGHSIGATAMFYALHKFDKLYIEKVVSLGAPSDIRIMIDNFYKILKLNNNIRTAFDNFLEERFKITINEFNVTNFVKDINIPILLSHDKNDDVVAFSEAKKIEKTLINKTNLWLKNGDHSMHDEQLYKEINYFLMNLSQ